MDLEKGRIMSDEEVKDESAPASPTTKWLKEYKIKLDDVPEPQGDVQAIPTP